MSSYEERYKALVEQQKAKLSLELEAADAKRDGRAVPAPANVNAETSDTGPATSTQKLRHGGPSNPEKLTAIKTKHIPFLPTSPQKPSALNVQHPLSDIRSTIRPQQSPPAASTLPNPAKAQEKDALHITSVEAPKPPPKQAKIPLRPHPAYKDATGPIHLAAPLTKPLGSAETGPKIQRDDAALQSTPSRPKVDIRAVPRIPLAPPTTTKHSLSPPSRTRALSTEPPSKKVKQVAPLSGQTPRPESSTGSTNTPSAVQPTQPKNIKVTRPHAPPKYVRPADASSRPNPTPGRVLPPPAKDLYPGVTARDAQRVNSSYKDRLLRANLQFEKLRDLYQGSTSHVEEKEDAVHAILQELQFCDFITLPLLRATNFLGAGRGFNILLDCSEMNHHIKADAEALEYKWLQEDYDPYLLRGIDYIERSVNGKTRKNPKLSPEWKVPQIKRYYEGHGTLNNGQWWPMQICAKRDGAHRELEAGIAGDSKNGADSIVLSDAGYSDNDNGTNIVYCGTSGRDGEMTNATKLLLISHHANKSIRVLRSSKLKSKYAPSAGIRYDGLYKIVAFVVVDQDTAMHQFRLQRVEGQDPIRFEGRFVRPNALERREWEKIRSLIDGKGT